jgi:hypothetical protein
VLRRRACLCGRAEQAKPGGRNGGLEVSAVVVLAADQDLARPAGRKARLRGEDAQQGLPLIGPGARPAPNSFMAADLTFHAR